MKKDIQEFFNHMHKKVPEWMNIQNLVFLIVILAFIIIVLWSEPLSYFFEKDRSVEVLFSTTPTILPGTPTPLPEELVRSAKQTNGVILGAIIIILTVVAGTAAILIRDKD